MLVVEALSIHFSSYTFGLRRREVCAIESLDLQVSKGEVMAIVGQSGSGKSLLAHALLGVLPRNARVGGRIHFKGHPLTPDRMKALRGREIALIPQSVSYLNPLLSVGRQVARAARLGGIARQETPQAVHRTLARYQLHPQVQNHFPHQLSGGMARRVLTATATIGNADLIVADEPTNGLHPTAAAETLQHLRELADAGKGVVLITHDIDAALRVADRVTVFKNGVTVEVAPREAFLTGIDLQHPYSKALWEALPRNGFMASLSLDAPHA